MRYRFVLLDVGETLVGPAEPFGAVYARVHRELGFDHPAERWDAAIRSAMADLVREIPPGADRYAHFGDGEEGYWRRFVVRTQEIVSGTGRDGIAGRALGLLREAFRVREAWRVYPDVVPALERMRADGARLGVVSNWDSRLPEVLDLVGLAPYFDAVGVSHLEGVEKPDPAFFLRILGRLGGAPRDALHVGDVPELDAAGARAAGIDAVLVGRRRPVGGSLHDLDELPAIVRGERPLPG